MTTDNGSIPKVLFLNPWDRLIGPNRYLVEMLRHAPELAGRSAVVIHENNDARNEYQSLGCRVEIWPEIAPIHPRLSLNNFVHLLHTHTVGLARLIPRLKALSPMVVVSNTENLWLGGLIGKLLRVPHFQVFHGDAWRYRLSNKGNLLKAYLRFLSFWNHRFIGVSYTGASALIQGGLLEDKVTIIPNPIPVNRIRAQMEAEIFPELAKFMEGRFPVLLCSGRIFPVKGQDLLIEALPAIRDRYPGLLCLFAGRVGSTAGMDDTVGFYHQIQERICDLNLEKHVRFVGEIENLPALLNQIHLYVQPSRSESFCRAVAEALVCGVPVVAFAVGAIPEVAGGGATFARPRDSADLSQTILTTLIHLPEAQRRAQEGRTHVEQQFNAIVLAKRFYLLLAQSVCRSHME
jgi:glycosyltransferase involved in cell wall biosynthesis